MRCFKSLSNQRIVALAIGIIVPSSICLAQEQIKFDYDDYGNRVRRYVPMENLSTKSFVFDEDDSVSIEMPDVATDVSNYVKVYPNPTTDYLYIDINSLKNCSYQLSNNKGVVLENARLQKNVIDLSQYVSGIYHLIIKNDDLEEIFEIVKE